MGFDFAGTTHRSRQRFDPRATTPAAGPAGIGRAGWRWSWPAVTWRRFDPPGQVRAGGSELHPALHGEEVAVSQAQHAGSQGGAELVDQGLLADRDRLGGGGDDPAGATGDQGDQPGLRKAATSRDSELLGDRIAGRKVDHRAIEGGAQQPKQVRTRDRLLAWSGSGLEHRPHRLAHQPAPGPRQRLPRRRRWPPSRTTTQRRSRPGPPTGPTAPANHPSCTGIAAPGPASTASRN